MPSFTTRLCNPTPFDAVLEWAAGRPIRVSAFGEKDLTMQQMDDFRPGKPGSAAARVALDYYGLFLLDIDRPYDAQALEAIRRSMKEKKAQYDAAHRNLVSSRAAAGVSEQDGALDKTLEDMGLTNIKNQVDILKEASVRFEKAVAKLDANSQRKQFDPKRTVFVTDPPREFPSVAAMEFFLAQNPDVAASHKAYKQQEDMGGVQTGPALGDLAETADAE